MDATVKVNGTSNVIQAGDAIDYGEHGVIVWLKGRIADAYRLERAEHAEKINQIIAFVEARCRDQKLD